MEKLFCMLEACSMGDCFQPVRRDLKGQSDDIYQLEQLGIGGYVVGRTAEKIVPQIIQINP